MSINIDCPLATTLAEQIRAQREDLTARWLERIQARVSIDADRIFPSEELLDHMPVLMDGIADYIEDPADEISADMPVIAKAMELGELRLSQGFDAHEILKEYEILGGVLYHFTSSVAGDSPAPCAKDELLTCGHRLFRAISVIEQVTTSQYLRVLGERVGEREERLRRFNRMITHELKNRVGAVIGAGQLLQEDWVGTDERERFATMVVDNAQSIQKALENLTALARLEGDRRRQQNIRLPEVVAEVFRQLRALARARQVRLRRGEDLPDVEVNAAAVELCLSNYVSNAIKYSDRAKRERWVEVEASIIDATGEMRASGSDAGAGNGRAAGEREVARELVVRVRDNGLGVPEEQRGRLFERFFRAHEGAGAVEGTGLGLSLVKETAEELGGRAWAEFDDSGASVFAFALPCSREGEQTRDVEPARQDAEHGPQEEPTRAEDAPIARGSEAQRARGDRRP